MSQVQNSHSLYVCQRTLLLYWKSTHDAYLVLKMSIETRAPILKVFCNPKITLPYVQVLSAIIDILHEILCLN